MVSLIVAYARSRVIGSGGKIPWNIPEEKRHFKALTMGGVLIMGRRSYEEIGYPLPGRTMMVLSSSKLFKSGEGYSCRSLAAALELAAEKFPEKEIFIAGGESVYKQALDMGLPDKLYITEVQASFEGDRFFPAIDEKRYTLVRREKINADTPCEFFTYVKARVAAGNGMMTMAGNIDKKKIMDGVRLILDGVGENADREGLLETPDRVARMCEEIFAGLTQDASIPLSKTFSVDHNEMVLERDIPFYSMCEHHLVPFYGKAHIAYMPNGRVVGLSKLSRTVDIYARRPQIQEQLTGQIADAVMKNLLPQGVMVVIEAEHMCMSMRGVKKPGVQTVTVAMRGCFENDVNLQNRVMQLIR